MPSRLKAFLLVFMTLAVFITYAAALDACSDEHCVFCSDIDIHHCIQCKPGYHPDLQGVCEPTCTDKRCTKCDAHGRCTDCAPSHLLLDGMCLKYLCNVLGCVTCTVLGDPACEDCQPGFIWNRGECIQGNCAVANCAKCYAEDTCMECAEGYHVQDGVCEQDACKDEHCTKCDARDLSKCTACAEGYHVQDGVCEQDACKDEHCTKCDARDLSKCTACAEGYHVQNGVCEQDACLVSKCKACHDGKPSICERCEDRFVKTKGGKCIPPRDAAASLKCGVAAVAALGATALVCML